MGLFPAELLTFQCFKEQIIIFTDLRVSADTLLDTLLDQVDPPLIGTCANKRVGAYTLLRRNRCLC